MKKMVIMAGLSGAGKSTVARARYAGLKTIDCDELKKLCKGYDPLNPAAVHEESKRLERIDLTKAICGDEDFIYDTTATNAERVVGIIKEAQEYGFWVELCYVKVSLKTALERNAKRERHVPEYIIREKNAVIGNALEILQGYVDSFVTVVNE